LALDSLGAPNYYVKPTDTSFHRRYEFWIKAVALYDTNSFGAGWFGNFGPYYLDVGCIEDQSTPGATTTPPDVVKYNTPAVVYEDNDSFVPTYTIMVGDVETF
jgi:hypothetical protein